MARERCGRCPMHKGTHSRSGISGVLGTALYSDGVGGLQFREQLLYLLWLDAVDASRPVGHSLWLALHVRTGRAFGQKESTEDAWFLSISEHTVVVVVCLLCSPGTHFIYTFIYIYIYLHGLGGLYLRWVPKDGGFCKSKRAALTKRALRS